MAKQYNLKPDQARIYLEQSGFDVNKVKSYFANQWTNAVYGILYQK